ncbi:MAG: S8 family serine peptidase [Phaeodactylibacter sp.]|uniref:S8 family serine peptidase n=1 Tax=Phaeodactylibacter sp. TaxID=1940289 RepID=UPI0032ECDBC5
MALDYYLYRGTERIKLERADHFFTAILPDTPSREALAQQPGFRQVSHVFGKVYKVETDAGQRDEIMADMRNHSTCPMICHHAYCPAGDPATRYYLTDQLILKFTSQLSTGEKEEILHRHGLRYLKSFDPNQQVCLVQVTHAAGRNPLKVSNALVEDGRLEYAEPNLINRFAPQYEPTDPLFAEQWHLQRRSGLELVSEAGVDCTEAWKVSRGDRAVTVAVIDDGFDLTHPDLSGPGKVTGARDYAGRDSYPGPERESGDFHGTPCAGVAIGEENGTGIVGAAPGCSFLPIRFPLSADDNLLFDLFDYAGRNAHVISCSWGPVPVYAPLSSLLSNQMERLHRSGGPDGRGCLVFFAAGNYNAPIKDLDNTGFTWRHPTQGLKTTTGPILNGYAAHPDVVAVAASTSLARKSAYSNWGTGITVAAPSDNWNPLNQQERLPGRGIWTTDNEDTGLGFAPGSRFTGNFGGTSSACPLAAGVAALIKSVNPQRSAAAILEILKATTDKITDESPDPVLGLRKGSYDAQGYSEWFGYGRINAAKAVRKAQPAADMKPDEPEPGERAIQIIAALVNPKGPEAGAEKLMLINLSDESVELGGWTILDQNGNTDQLATYTLQAGSVVRIGLGRVRLLNAGGTITLRNGSGQQIDQVAYTRAATEKEGWWIKFD